MIVSGFHAVDEALRSPEGSLRRVLVARGKGGKRLQEIVDRARNRKVTLQFVAPEALRRLTGTDHHQGVAAELSEIRLWDLEDFLVQSPDFLLLLDGVEDPHNLGAVLRTADGAGIEGVLLPDRHSCPVTPAVVQVSAGAAHHIPVVRVGNVAQTLEKLKDRGFLVVGLDMEGKSDLSAIDLASPLVLVVGGEHRGIRRLVKEKCDFLVSLPMRGQVESLNLSVATGIFVYQVLSHRIPRP